MQKMQNVNTVKARKLNKYKRLNYSFNRLYFILNLENLLILVTNVPSHVALLLVYAPQSIASEHQDSQFDTPRSAYRI